MNNVTSVLAVVALLGSAVIGGVFFAFSSFVMRALSRVPSHEGIAAMQSINVVVLNPSFLGTFMGTAILSAVIAVVAAFDWGTPPAPYLLAASMTYVIGTFLITMFGNVPLNNQLAAVTPTDAEAAALWEFYVQRWTLLNTIRTLAGVAASLLYTIGLMQGAWAS